MSLELYKKRTRDALFLSLLLLYFVTSVGFSNIAFSTKLNESDFLLDEYHVRASTTSIYHDKSYICSLESQVNESRARRITKLSGIRHLVSLLIKNQNTSY